MQLSGELQLWAHPAQQRTGNATVEVFGPDEQPWAQTPVTVRIGSRVITGQTDDQGRCRFDDLPAENLLFRLPRGDTVPWPGSYVIECRRLVRPARDVHITLGSPKCDARLVVEVVNREGAPLPGVVVKIEGDLYRQLVTDAVGQAAFERIAAGDYRVGLRGSALATSTAWASDQVVAVKAGEDRRERLELGASTLRGRVLAGSTAGLQLLVRRPDKQKSGQAGGDPRDPPGHNLLAATTVDANGNFFFTHTPHGEQRVSIVGEHRGVVCRRELTVEVPPDGDPAPVELRLLGLGVLRVEVTDPDGKPIRRGRVECFGREGRVPLPRRSSGARGIEFAAMLDPGAYRIEATTGTGSPVTRSLVIEPGEEEHVVIVLGR